MRRADHLPVTIQGRTVPVSREHAAHLSAAQAQDLYDAATDFRHFLRHWKFQSEEGEGVRDLSEENLYGSQATLADEMILHRLLYLLKARRLGATTLAAPFAAWRLRFHPQPGRCHIFSRDEKAAKALLQWISFGLEHLPHYLRLPATRDAAHTYVLAGDRTFESYSANGTSGVNQGCIHLLVDELARMADPQDLWQRVSPTIAPNGTAHILTVGTGPVGFHADLWRDEDLGFAKVFIPASARHSKFELALKRKEYTSDVEFRREYPETPEDALSGGGDLVFHAPEIEAATEHALPLQPCGVSGHRYVTAWDLGSRQDATVGTTLDVTSAPYLDVVGYIYLRNADYPQILAAIRAVHGAYDAGGGHYTVLEENGIGAVVLDSADLPRTSGFMTTKASKARIIEGIQMHLQRGHLQIPAECTELLSELRGYQIPDQHIRQDAVMSLAIAVDSADLPYTHRTGRVLSVLDGTTGENVRTSEERDRQRERTERDLLDGPNPYAEIAG